MEEGNQQQAEQQQQQQATESSSETNREQGVPGPSGQQDQPGSLPEPLTSSGTEGDKVVSQTDASSENKSDDVISETTSSSQVEQPSSMASLVAIFQEFTAVDKLNERDNGMTSSPAAPTANGNGTVPTNGLRITAHEMDLAELKVKIACQEKNNMALKMELKCAELQVAAKEKLDAKKTRLIELLDAKVAAVEKKNVRLIEMMEQIVRDKDTHSNRLVDATKNMEELSRRLTDSERARQELRNANRELKEMLDNVEGKGTKIARLAKEKVLKYKEENERMQRELDDLKGSGDGVAAAGSEVEGDNLDAHADSPAEDSSEFSVAFSKIEKLCGQLETAVVGKDQEAEQSVDSLRSALGEVARITGELKPLLLELPQFVHAAIADQVQNTTSTEIHREKSLKEEIDAKDREIATLKEELTRLKSAIGQLVGLNFGSGVTTVAALVSTASVAPASE